MLSLPHWPTTAASWRTQTSRPPTAATWLPPKAREELVDALAKDAHALLGVLDGWDLGPALSQAAELLAIVTGQDLEQDAGGVFKIARRVAPDRVISTVDPQARHGHKSRHRSFDGYKGHIAIDPDSEIVTATGVTPGNSGDAEAAGDLLADVLPGASAGDGSQAGAADEAQAGAGEQCQHAATAQAGTASAGSGRAAVYGDAAYGAGELLERVEDTGLYSGVKVQPPAAVKDHFPKDRFAIDLDAKTVTCPAGVTVPIRASGRDRHAGEAKSGGACRACPLAAQCTTAGGGRTITIGPHEARLARRPPGPDEPGLAGRLQGHQAQGGTQNRPPHAPAPRRAPRPGPRAAQGRRRFHPAHRRCQPGQARGTRCHHRRRKLGNGCRVTSRTWQAPAIPWQSPRRAFTRPCLQRPRAGQNAAPFQILLRRPQPGHRIITHPTRPRSTPAT
jgi:Transposase DDE domain